MDLSRKFRVTGVPKTVVNDTIEIVGALPEADFIELALQTPDRVSGDLLALFVNEGRGLGLLFRACGTPVPRILVPS